ncbi:divergent polysaccharide deacetylase family protein [Elioraea thermophila]|uniref:divergent polysaccharide deacetylase family protein n=1 Tax=Elioraea thermophila TaxID=2185104 RepID=UPI0022B8229F|nr:divergent polysaccharide deacetylase family protein [Elioraea thermophila]
MVAGGLALWAEFGTAPPETVEAAPAVSVQGPSAPLPSQDPPAEARRGPPIEPERRPGADGAPGNEPAPAAQPAWRSFARPFDESDRRPRLAILVVGLGMSETATRFAIDQLPGAISLAFSPYGLNLDTQMAAARAAGHEVLLGIPMEPANFPLNDPGPRALMTGNPPPENLARLQWVLGRGTGYVGVTNAASAVLRGERFMTATEAMRPVYEVLQQRGLLFIEARPGERAPTAVPSRTADLVVDERMSRPEIEARLADLERLARERGVALGIAGPSQLTLERLAAWSQGVEFRGVLLAPVSAVVTRPTAQARP